METLVVATGLPGVSWLLGGFVACGGAPGLGGGDACCESHLWDVLLEERAVRSAYIADGQSCCPRMVYHGRGISERTLAQGPGSNACREHGGREEADRVREMMSVAKRRRGTIALSVDVVKVVEKTELDDAGASESTARFLGLG